MVHKGVAYRITQGLTHRGPDQQGIFEGSEATLCAVRLKIIDLDGGDQPFVSEDGDYGDRVQRRDLQSPGNPRGTGAAGASIPLALRHRDGAAGVSGMGHGMFPRMRGMFAVALWTESRKRLVLARDRMGIKPLYYFHRGDDVYFGSELKAILEHPEVPRRLDLAALDSYLSVNYVPGPHTLIEGIRKVPAGYLLEWQCGKVSIGALVGAAVRGRRGRISLEGAKEELDWAAARLGPGAPGVGRAAGSVGIGRAGFIDDPALRGDRRQRGG